jgi:protein involved in polysaccharide export with SLBB domain
MQAGEGRVFRPSLWQVWHVFLLLLAGCATSEPLIERALFTDPSFAASTTHTEEAYIVRCPDVLELAITGQADLSGPREVGPDGRIDLASLGRLRVEGLPLAEIRRRVAEVVPVPESCVRLAMVEYKSQQVYLIGQIAGLQRAVAYQGSETVVQVLRRAGGLTPGAALDDVYVVRSHVAEGARPEVFRVDLRAILLQQDSHSNVTIQPLDQIYVGETRRCSLERCIPPWLRPLYESCCGLRKEP